MTPEIFTEYVLDPGLKLLEHVGGPHPSDDARRFLLAVALTESGPNLDARYQNSPSTTPGPARGWYQFEQSGGTQGVLNHSSSMALAHATCEFLVVVPESGACWRAMEGNGPFATVFARLLLLTDPYPIPTTEEAAWECYANRLWRPGAPNRSGFHSAWETACRMFPIV